MSYQRSKYQTGLDIGKRTDYAWVWVTSFQDVFEKGPRISIRMMRSLFNTFYDSLTRQLEKTICSIYLCLTTLMLCDAHGTDET